MQSTWHTDSPFRDANSPSSQQPEYQQYQHLEKQWRSLVEKTLNGAKLEDKLTSTTLDDIKIQAIYSQATASAQPHYTKKPWHIQQTYGTGNPFSTSQPSLSQPSLSKINTQILQELDNGVSAIELAMHNAENKNGIHCHTVTEMEQLLAGVYPEMIHTSLLPAANNIAAAGLLESLWRSRNIPLDQVFAAYNADPLGALANTGRVDFSGANWSDQIVDLAQHTIEHLPNVTCLCVDTGTYHNAGASEAQELAFAIATGLSYLRALHNSGINIKDAAGQIIFRFSLDSDFFLSVAKLRAARQLWSQVLSHCHNSDDSIDTAMALQAQSGLRCISERDPYVNILRVTTQAFAAMTGGAQGFNSVAFDINCPQQTPRDRKLGRKIARNTQLILLEESHLDQVQDPLSGSGFVEALTGNLCQKAWEIFQHIETRGGMQDALTSGYVQSIVTEKRNKREQDLANGKTSVIGVSEFANLQEPPSQSNNHYNSTTNPADSDPNTAIPEPRKTLASHNFADILHAIGEGADYRSVDAQLRTNKLTAPALIRFRDGAVFENMVARSASYQDTHGRPPQVMLVTLGSPHEYSSRTNFCANFFASAGIHTSVIAMEDINPAQADKPLLAVLCSSDKRYASDAAEACKTLASTPSTEVWLAGAAKDLESALSDNGLARQLHIKSNKVELLQDALTFLAVK